MSQDRPESPSNCFLDLLQKAQAGDREAMGQLLQDRREYLLYLANRQLPKDLRSYETPSDFVQDTILAAQQHFAQFKGQSAGEFLTWLGKILHNALCDFIRVNRRRRERLGGREVPFDPHARRDPASRLASGTRSPADELIHQEEHLILQPCLGQLPKNYQRAIRLRAYEKRSFQAMGNVLGGSEAAARQTYLRALRTKGHLMEELEEVK